MTLFNLKIFIPLIKIKNAKKLSSGQQQRIILINLMLDIIYNNKKIIFLDECTANIDVDNEQIIFQELKKLQYIYSITIFYTSHNQSNMEYSDFNYIINTDTFSVSKQVTKQVTKHVTKQVTKQVTNPIK